MNPFAIYLRRALIGLAAGPAASVFLVLTGGRVDLGLAAGVLAGVAYALVLAFTPVPTSTA